MLTEISQTKTNSVLYSTVLRCLDFVVVVLPVHTFGVYSDTMDDIR